jgi:hypothetical protein
MRLLCCARLSKHAICSPCGLHKHERTANDVLRAPCISGYFSIRIPTLLLSSHLNIPAPKDVDDRKHVAKQRLGDTMFFGLIYTKRLHKTRLWKVGKISYIIEVSAPTCYIICNVYFASRRSKTINLTCIILCEYVLCTWKWMHRTAADMWHTNIFEVETNLPSLLWTLPRLPTLLQIFLCFSSYYKKT